MSFRFLDQLEHQKGTPQVENISIHHLKLQKPHQKKMKFDSFCPQKLKRKLKKRTSLSRPNKCNGWRKYYNQINSQLTDVCEKLSKLHVLYDFNCLIELIYTDKFPMDNIAFCLLLDVARWYSLKSTTQMYYSKQSLLFWRVCINFIVVDVCV